MYFSINKHFTVSEKNMVYLLYLSLILALLYSSTDSIMYLDDNSDDRISEEESSVFQYYTQFR